MQDRVSALIDAYHLNTDIQVRTLDLVSEVGELAKEVLKGSEYGRKVYEHTPYVQEELGDCLFSLLALFHALNQQPEQALELVIQKYTQRFAQSKQFDSGNKPL